MAPDSPLTRRDELQALLVSILGSDNVYFQPPESKQMLYPCFVYQRDQINSRFADNAPYKHKTRYSVTYINEDPDSDVVLDKMKNLPMCTHVRFYVVDNLNHDVFDLYF